MQIPSLTFGKTLFADNAESLRETLENAVRQGVNLKSANLTFANLEGANLEGANLTFAKLKDANLKGANLEFANLKDANLEGANLEGANLPILSTIEEMPIRKMICEKVCESPDRLEMSTWHTCDTVHCIAGWTVVLHPAGRIMEALLGTPTAAALILWKCEGEVPNFYASNEQAMTWLKSEKTWKELFGGEKK